MRAIGITRAGGPEVIEIVERPETALGPHEIRIAVAAAAVNPADLGMRRSGNPTGPPPWTPGMDVAGAVEAVGEEVGRLLVGQQVMAVVNPFSPHGGAQAATVVVPAASAVPVPRNAPTEQAATLPMNGLTARYGLERLNLEAGSTLAVSGGAGHLASFVIPMAKARGVTVIADAHAEDAPFVQQLGADHVIARSGDFARAVRVVVTGGVDGVFDTAALNEAALGALRDDGQLVSVCGWRPEAPERGVRVHQVFVRDVMDRTEWLEDLREMAEAGRLHLRKVRTFRPEDAGSAHALLEAGGVRGRCVLVFT